MRILTTLFLACALLGFAASAPASTSVPQQGQIAGEVLQVFPTIIVIKNEQGQATVLQLNPRTRLGTTFKPGDKVVASLTLYGVSSIQLQTTTALMP
jgi:hypothetical protein